MIPSLYFPEHVASLGPLCHPGDFVLKAVRYQPSVLHMTEPQWLRDRTYLGTCFFLSGVSSCKIGGALSSNQNMIVIRIYEQVQTLIINHQNDLKSNHWLTLRETTVDLQVIRMRLEVRNEGRGLGLEIDVTYPRIPLPFFSLKSIVLCSI